MPTEIEIEKARKTLDRLHRADVNIKLAHEAIRQGSWVAALDLLSDARTIIAIACADCNDAATEQMQISG